MVAFVGSSCTVVGCVADPKLVGVESLLLRVDPASGEELLTSPPYSASSESIMPQVI